VKTKNKQPLPRIVFGALIIVVILFALYSFRGTSAADGDAVQVNYIGKLQDGSVFDTSIQTEAVKANIYEKTRTYQPLSFIIGQKQVVPGFEQAVRGMKKGETKTVTIPPEQAYGQAQPDLILRDIKKTFQTDESMTIPLKEFMQVFNKQPQLQEILSPSKSPFTLQVSAIQNDTITLRRRATIGQTIQSPEREWPMRVTAISDGKITFTQEPRAGQRIVSASQNKIGKVIRVGTDDYDVDFNHPLAGKTLIFTITLVDFKKA